MVPSPSQKSLFTVLSSFIYYVILPPLNHQNTISFLTEKGYFHFKNPIFMASKNQSNFQDFLPLMAEKLGGDGLIGELCNGFQVLMDSDKGVITFESLKKNSALLGLKDMSDDDLHNMLNEGDFDGDGALNQMEFCVLMFRLSPELMEQSYLLLEEAFQS
ncbi:calcium-binding protein PBP1-like [Olea europaea var. sylvestris]|uniref:calcium-binding protein PBP1-like n=1 Tax=Olea europaea var. sylvestris TaxID=158386 RepID=UPI000C1D0212|nr:calcium-binding protein PBP1-like [Olea europaea var. sylvestris]